MNETLLNHLHSRKGQFSHAAWSRPCKTRKGSPEIIKTTVATVRAGINYDNLSKVKEKRENGDLPAENAGLPWGEWFTFPYLITHKDNLYVKLYPSGGETSAKVEYMMDGMPATYEQVEPYLLASEKRKETSELDCFTVKLESLITLE